MEMHGSGLHFESDHEHGARQTAARKHETQSWRIEPPKTTDYIEQGQETGLGRGCVR